MKKISIVYLILFTMVLIFKESPALDEGREIEYYSQGGYSYLTEEEESLLKKLKNKTITLGVPDYGGYNSVAIGGREYGISHLYKMLLEDHLGLSVSFYHGKWGELQTNLKEGKIDILMGMTPTRNRMKHIYFTAPYAPDSGVIITPIDYPEVDSFKDLRGKRVYLQEGSSYEEIGRSNGEKYGFETIGVEDFDYNMVGEETFVFGTEELVTDILKKGARGIKAVPIYQEEPVTIGVSKKRGRGFYNILNKSLKEVFYKPISSYMKELKWEMGRELLEINLTEEEKSYLKGKRTLDIYLEDGFFPHIFYSESKRRYKGAQVEIIDEIAEVLGLEVSVLNEPGTSWRQILEGYSRGRGDFLILFRTKEREGSFLFTQDIYEEEVLLVGDRSRVPISTKVEAYLDYRIGVVDGDANHILAKRYYSDEKIVTARDSEELVEMLERGEVDYIILVKGTLTYLQSYKFKTNLITAAKIDKVPIVFGMKRFSGSSGERVEKNLLRGILDKALIFCIEVDSKYQRWSTYTHDTGRRLKVMNRGLLVALALLAGGCVKFYINGRLIRRQKDSLYNLLHYDQEVGCRNRTSYEADLEPPTRDDRGGSIIRYEIEGLYELAGLYRYNDIDEAMKRGIELVEEIIDERGRVYRITKDEFAIILPGIAQGEAETTGRRILEELNTPSVIRREDHGNIRVNVGVAGDEEKLFKADTKSRMAKHLAKAGGRGELVAAGGDIYERFNWETQQEERVKEALRRREFIPYFQARKNLREDRITGCEVLARWQDRDGNIIFPGEFIHVAEGMGIIGELDMQIAEKSMRQIRKWLDEGIIETGFRVSLNLSVRTLEREGILEDISYFMEKYAIPSESLEIEVTETIFIESQERIRRILGGLKKLGVVLALDDFSAGHSSAKYLHDFDFDIVKLDRSLLPQCEGEDSKMKIYKTLRDLIDSLGMKSVAEGIESEGHEKIVTKIGVDEGQGYYYNKPENAEEFEEHILKKSDRF